MVSFTSDTLISSSILAVLRAECTTLYSHWYCSALCRDARGLCHCLRTVKFRFSSRHLFWTTNNFLIKSEKSLGGTRRSTSILECVCVADVCGAVMGQALYVLVYAVAPLHLWSYSPFWVLTWWWNVRAPYILSFGRRSNIVTQIRIYDMFFVVECHYHFFSFSLLTCTAFSLPLAYLEVKSNSTW